MRTITQGELRITGDACFGAVEKAQLHQAFGEHGTLEALVWLKAGTEGNDGDMRWNGLPVCLMASGKKDDFLFSGVVRRAAFVKINGRRAVELTAASYTYLLDREKRTRTFQQESRTYRKFAVMLMSRVRGACIWNGEGGNDTVGSFLMQYGESDWEFLRRVASMQGQPLIPEVRWAGARTYIGLMESGDVKTLESGEYRIRKTLAKIPGQADNVGRGYLCGNRELQVWDRYEECEPGERVSVNGSILTVAEKTSYIKNSQWLNSYGFMESRACRTETIRTPRPSGVAVRGSVIEADMDKSRLRLVTDGFGESPESTHLCPVYYAGSGKGYSGQPEKGDVQYLYFPTGQDKDRYVIGSVDAGSEKMEQLDKRERDENAGAASKTESTGTELSEVKRWNTPGNRRMVLNRNGVSFADSWKGGLNVQCGGIRVYTNGNMALEAKEIAGDGRKITAEAGDYVWLGSGSSGMVLLPDQIHISAADVYMKSPLNWIHKIIDEETTETLLDLYEEMKTAAPPIYAPDGTLIRRDGYDDILYSEELYDYFLNHVVGKEEGYERKHDEPYVTLYEQWLDETYGHSAMWYFWDYVFSIDGLQTMLSIAGIFYYPIHYVNAAIYLLRGDLKKTGKSIVMGVSQKYLTQFIEELAAIGYDGLTVGMTSDDVVTELYFRYLAEENSAKLFAEIGPLSEEMINSMRYSMTGVGIAEGIFYKDLAITAEVVDSEGNVIGKVTAGGDGTELKGKSEASSSIEKRYLPNTGKIPPRVQSRINLANGPTRFTPLRESGQPVSAGFQHIIEQHFNRPLANNRSIFSVTPDELKVILQSPQVVSSPVSVGGNGMFVRIADAGKIIGNTSLRFGGKETSWIKIFTDCAGNIITAFPVPRP